MQVSSEATKGHLIVGVILVLLALGSLVTYHVTQWSFLPAMIFFFGVWGGVELGRYLEHWRSLRGGQ